MYLLLEDGEAVDGGSVIAMTRRGGETLILCGERGERTRRSRYTPRTIASRSEQFWHEAAIGKHAQDN